MPKFETPEPISAVVELIVGDIRISASERRDTEVEVRPSDSAKQADVNAAEQTRVEYSAGRLLIRATRRWRSWSPFGYGGSVDVHVGLPSGSQVTGGVAMGAFRGTGPLGECRVKTSLADIHLEHAGAVELMTATGDISVERAIGDAEVITASGEIRLGQIDGAAVLKNSNGNIRIGESGGEARVTSANGNVTIERAHASVSAKTAHGDIRVGAAGPGAVVAETGLGAVEVAIADGVAAWLDLHTKYGHLHNDLDAAGPPQPSDKTIEVRARSGYGDITVRRLPAPVESAP
jgi:Toastrack DUF4097